MTSFEHKKIVKKLIELDELPLKKSAMPEWIKAEAHLSFLESNTQSQEIVVDGSLEYSFVYSMVFPEDFINPLDENDLLGLNLSPHSLAASYTWGGGRDDVWIERRTSETDSKILAKGSHLIYERTFQGWCGEDRDYFELSQEYAHLEDLHWRPERSSYCRFDEQGDLKPIVSITRRNSTDKISLVTFDRSSLDSYLAVSNQVLVRIFDFTLLDKSIFSGWGSGDETVINNNNTLFYKQKIHDNAAYTTGVQIVRPRRPKSLIFSEIKRSVYGETDKNHLEFIAFDFRKKQLKKISTDPKETVNYFEAKNNDLPYELSPAFFKPEVLLKYKADKEKYTVGERKIHCRATWTLRAFDVNEAGQVFAYICDLRKLPSSELLYWLSFNEKPKASISERAYENDFKGEFFSFTDPLEKIKNISLDWNRNKYSWWNLQNDNLIDNTTVPLTSSRDEWAESFLALTKLINEGFIVKDLRKRLREKNVPIEKTEGSLSLLEKIINSHGGIKEPLKLDGLREAQRIRSKVKSHSESSAESLSIDALSKHGTYASHFRHVCGIICDELKIIQRCIESN